VILYGHVSRVWRGLLLPHCIVTIGEDATCCVWDYGGNMTRRWERGRNRSQILRYLNNRLLYTPVCGLWAIMFFAQVHRAPRTRFVEPGCQ